MPARNEEDNLRRLAAAMLAQHVRPVAWVIVENGSVDGTLDIALELEHAYSWVRVLRTQASNGYDRTSAYMNAFHRGVDELDGAGDVVVKLDADVSFEPDYFAGLVQAFEDDPQLGIASGTLLEVRGGGWREIVLLGDHCWGPTRAYRRACLEVVLPLDDSVGYSVIDETRAHLAGFRTRTLRQLPFRHHRPKAPAKGVAGGNGPGRERGSLHRVPILVLRRSSLLSGVERSGGACPARWLCPLASAQAADVRGTERGRRRARTAANAPHPDHRRHPAPRTRRHS